MSKLRVAMIGWEFPPLKVGGLAVHCYNLAYELASNGVEVDFYMPKTHLNILSPHKNIRIIPVTDSKLEVYLGRPLVKEGKVVFSNLYVGNINNVIDHYAKLCSHLLSFFHSIENYSLIHGHDWITVLACQKSKEKTGIPWVHSFHSTEYDRNAFPWDYILKIEQQGITNADLLITVSNRMKNLLIDKYAADPSKIKVIYNGINPQEFTKSTIIENKEKSDVAKHLKGKKI